MQAEETVTRRIPMLDVARFFGIILVYYGHIVERIMYLENPAAAAQYKFIYSFHMVLFFLLAGFTIDPQKISMPTTRFLRRLTASRLIPYFFFTAILAVLSVLFTGWFVAVDLTKAAGYLEGVVSTLLGFPVFCIPLWFMACLVSVEIIHFLVGRLLDSTAKLILAAMAFYVAGYFLTLKVNLLGGATYWLVHEALVMYAFYLVGVLLRRKLFFFDAYQHRHLLLASGICLLAVVLTWDLNQGPFQMLQAVVIVLSGHGNFWLFPFTALAGSLLVLFVARLAGANHTFMYLGENALILFCLNGVFYHFLNGPFANWFTSAMPGHWVAVTGAGTAFTMLSIIACIPLILMFNRFAPFLVGKRRMPAARTIFARGFGRF